MTAVCNMFKIKKNKKTKIIKNFRIIVEISLRE